MIAIRKGIDPQVIQEPLSIAWDYLNRTGQTGDAMRTYALLTDSLSAMINNGEVNKIRLANKAISDYEKKCRALTIDATSNEYRFWR